MRLLPEGTLTQQRLDEVVVTRGEESEVVQLVMHTGLGLSLQFFWATMNAEHHFFAAILLGNTATIKEGWEVNLAELKRRQQEASGRILEKRAKELQHPMNYSTQCLA